MDQLFYVSGVALWVICGFFMLMALMQWLNVNIPRVLRGNGWTVYKLGIGEIVIITDAEMVSRMVNCGFRLHVANRCFWAAQILRWSV